MSVDGAAVVGESSREEARIDVTETSFAWVRSFVRGRDAHFERDGEKTYLVLD
ncbi:hypothetical protein J2752_002095 [Halarchaeum rubridurum]|uniref:Uncharacterized protein n=1 Tax=Halarchaeum rubridurum TaxID=489911 RepID=A0A830FZS8_9EURY|nr:hypothetical protein [Halarchaeum rubridurum]MBP1955183.1 hypothetical protein [Halarchaeum rubridurum]GGM68277.1 hypothetical protein GCM10009017_18120 [Halarchaeum rubridurum]